ncbi:MAG: GNAT family N-acetyltransferase [Caulobacterales bacterium]
MPSLSLQHASLDERGALENLLQLYAHDFSEFSPEDEHTYELDADGRFEPYPHLDLYWREEGRLPLLIRLDGVLIGFALLNRVSPSGAAVDYNLAEFFIARKYRRNRLGSAAAEEIFARYPGRWEVAVTQHNLSALVFWQSAIRAHLKEGSLEQISGDGARWRGPIFRFTSR